MPNPAAGWKHIVERQRLFHEMLAVTRDLDDALAIEEVTSDSLGVIDSLIEVRERLISQIRELDSRELSGVAHNSEQCCSDPAGPSVDPKVILGDIERTVEELVSLQERIDKRLVEHRAKAAERIKEVRRHRKSISGYYDSTIAGRPRYVDARK